MPSHGAPPAHFTAHGYHTALENSSCHPGKREHPVDESPQGTNPFLMKAIHSIPLFGIDRCDSAFCITEVLGPKHQSRDPPPRAIQPPWIPQSHEGRALACDLGKVQPRTVNWPNFTPSVASLAPKLVLRSGQLRIKKLELPVHLLSPPKSEEQTIRAIKC